MLLRKETIVGVFIISAVGVFFYMSFQIGTFRFDKLRYNSYFIYFNDISGLAVKADVKIAGVKVGWVDSVELLNNGQQVRARAMIFKEYKLHTDAFGTVRQEGFLGSKYLEIVPGDALLPTIRSGGTLMKPSNDASSVDQLLQQFKKISSNIEDVTVSLKNVIGGERGQEKLEQTIHSFTNATDQLAKVSDTLNTLIDRNQNSLETILVDVQEFSRELKTRFPTLAQDLSNASNSISNDFHNLSTSLTGTSKSLEDISSKVSNGKGVIGRLINDQDLSKAVKTAVEGIKEYLEKVQKLAIVVDGHTESYHSFIFKANFRDAAGQINVRIHPVEDYFYLVGITASQRGSVDRYQTWREWRDCSYNRFRPDDFNLTTWEKFKFAPVKEKAIRHFDTYMANVQVGKVFGNLALRTGLFNGTFGAAVDLNVPYGDKLRWVSSLEGYDFRGRLRLEDTRPHLKWMNKVFLLPTAYVVFGADDFVSRHDKSAFAGFGLQFSDDDLKYFASKLTFMG